MNQWTKSLLAAGITLGLSTSVWAFSLSDAVDTADKAMTTKQDVDNSSETVDETALKNDLKESAIGGFPVAGDTADLVSSLTNQLGITPKQAAGGTAALFSQAQSELPSGQFGGITDKVSGLTALLGGGEDNAKSGLAGSLMKAGAGSLGGVTSAFEGLGMSADMIGKFVPVVSKFLGGQGVAGTAINALKGVWGAAG